MNQNLTHNSTKVPKTKLKPLLDHRSLNKSDLDISRSSDISLVPISKEPFKKIDTLSQISNNNNKLNSFGVLAPMKLTSPDKYKSLEISNSNEHHSLKLKPLNSIEKNKKLERLVSVDSPIVKDERRKVKKFDLETFEEEKFCTLNIPTHKSLKKVIKLLFANEIYNRKLHY